MSTKGCRLGEQCAFEHLNEVVWFCPCCTASSGSRRKGCHDAWWQYDELVLHCFRRHPDFFDLFVDHGPAHRPPFLARVLRTRGSRVVLSKNFSEVGP